MRRLGERDVIRDAVIGSGREPGADGIGHLAAKVRVDVAGVHGLRDGFDQFFAAVRGKRRRFQRGRGSTGQRDFDAVELAALLGVEHEYEGRRRATLVLGADRNRVRGDAQDFAQRELTQGRAEVLGPGDALVQADFLEAFGRAVLRLKGPGCGPAWGWPPSPKKDVTQRPASVSGSVGFAAGLSAGASPADAAGCDAARAIASCAAELATSARSRSRPTAAVEGQC